MTSAKQDQDIIVHLTENCTNARVPLPKLRKLARIVCGRFGGDKAPAVRYEISIAVVDDTQIRELSSRFLSREATTDCLSFDLSDSSEEKPQAEKPASRVFELVVNGEMAARQAGLRGHSGQAELALYVAHGLLHNFGFDDATPSRAGAMHQAEDEILQQLGYGSVYNKKK
ncbi:MAG: rRNA maturation RNase YbeY [Planctomycetes bacterium RBG_16_55_9]|nr:MAG: rRNA maturation RNase YbeY [Planctomycetes bacterium RBG_16_55_9]